MTNDNPASPDQHPQLSFHEGEVQVSVSFEDIVKQLSEDQFATALIKAKNLILAEACKLVGPTPAPKKETKP